jgi:peptidoglycan/LPS O-acetylase OafA/YrhL
MRYAPAVDRARAQPNSPPATGIPGLTGIRGIAAAYVFLTHYQLLAGTYLDSPQIKANSFMYNGFRGVDLFFVLSGFILMHVHSRDFDYVKWPRLRVFYGLRFMRVYPLNTIVLLALLPVGLGLPDFVSWCRLNDGVDPQYHLHEFSAPGFVQTLFLAQTWTALKLGEWNGPSWTLSAEVIGYAFFPFAAYVLNRMRSPAACIGFAACSFVVLIALMVSFGHANNNPTGSFGLIRMAFSFVAGICLSRAFHLLQPYGRWPGTVITLASVLFIALALGFRQANVLTVWGFGGLIFGLAFRQGPVSALVESRVVMFMGQISFSFYLIHYIPLKLALWLFETAPHRLSLGSRIVVLVAMPVVCVAMATLMYRYLERPTQRMARRILGRRQSPLTLLHTAAPLGAEPRSGELLS